MGAEESRNTSGVDEVRATRFRPLRVYDDTTEPASFTEKTEDSRQRHSVSYYAVVSGDEPEDSTHIVSVDVDDLYGANPAKELVFARKLRGLANVLADLNAWQGDTTEETHHLSRLGVGLVSLAKELGISPTHDELISLLLFASKSLGDSVPTEGQLDGMRDVLKEASGLVRYSSRDIDRFTLTLEEHGWNPDYVFEDYEPSLP